MPRYRGITTVTSCPSAPSALGSAATTSASPPVLANGTASLATIRMRRRRAGRTVQSVTSWRRRAADTALDCPRGVAATGAGAASRRRAGASDGPATVRGRLWRRSARAAQPACGGTRSIASASVRALRTRGAAGAVLPRGAAALAAVFFAGRRAWRRALGRRRLLRGGLGGRCHRRCRVGWSPAASASRHARRPWESLCRPAHPLGRWPFVRGRPRPGRSGASGVAGRLEQACGCEVFWPWNWRAPGGNCGRGATTSVAHPSASTRRRRRTSRPSPAEWGMAEGGIRARPDGPQSCCSGVWVASTAGALPASQLKRCRVSQNRAGLLLAPRTTTAT